jgi:phosphatidylglycerol:prolipoprotein diacylglycerol transferase
MRRTLFLIPHEIASIPVFGFGWILAFMVLLAVMITVRLVMKKQSIADHWFANGGMWAMALGVVVGVMPRLELVGATGETVGMAVRGYGVMLLLGVLASVVLALARARRYGISDDEILGIAPWLIGGGLVGARTFYVVEYRDQFISGSFLETLGNILNFTEGGLVVYGSFIGGFLAGVFYVTRNRLPFLRFGDVIVPCLFIGLSLGRIGCLMNGCCYGGPCADSWQALRFPNGSPVYTDQLASGELIGVQLSSSGRAVKTVVPDSLADQAGIKAGDTVDQLAPRRWIEEADPARPAEDAPLGLIAVIDGKEYAWPASDLPTTANPVRPTQIMSSIGGLLLCLGLCLLSRFVHRSGIVMFVGFASYAVLRFIMEILRNDEPGQFGTELTIAQWVSIVVFTLSMIGLAWLWWRGNGAVQEHSIRAAGG